MRSTGFGGLILIIALLMVPSTVRAQEASLSGTVTDSTGGVLPGVVVRAVHEASGNSFEAVTDGSGTFRLEVRVGAYRILAELAGFTTVNRTGLELLVGQQAVITLQMTPATLQESVTVTAEAPLIDTTQSSLSSNIDPRQLQELPVNGRNWIDLTMLAPGSRHELGLGGPGVGNREHGSVPAESRRSVGHQQHGRRVRAAALQP